MTRKEFNTKISDILREFNDSIGPYPYEEKAERLIEAFEHYLQNESKLVKYMDRKENSRTLSKDEIRLRLNI